MAELLTAEEFEAWYAEKTDTPVEVLRSRGLYPVKCNCGDYRCRGWMMTLKLLDGL